MSANLNIENGNVAFFGTQPAWHKQGQVVDGAQTSEEAIKLAHLDFGVTKRPLYTNGNDDGLVTIPDKYATVRMDNGVPLGVVGSKYTILQNRDAFTFIDELVGGKEAIFETAGALGKGERIFITCKLPEKLVVGLDDVADNYFFITNTHDGSGSVEVMFTPVFVVCQNTVKLALSSGKRKQKVRHTTSVGTSLLKAADLMGITRESIQEKQELFTRLTKVRITDPQLKAFIEKVMHPGKEQLSREEYSTRFKNTVDKIYGYALGDPAQLIQERRGTLWGAYNAITGYYNNVATYKQGEDRLNSIIYGSANNNANKALSLAIDVFTGTLSLS
jgi:phage/plasmid-like protein (TIGR03299 family)